jgi:division protein CdvB (Snf7/Vps24/ESCRT-III family)
MGMIFKKDDDLSDVDKTQEKMRTLNIQSQKLKTIQENMKGRGELVFKLCVEAMSNHEEERAKIYADELSKIRGISSFLNNHIILIECITVKLETYIEFKNFVADMKPVIDVIRGISGMLANFMPQVSGEIQLMNSTLTEVLLTTTIDISRVPTIATSATPESESILKEVSSLLGERAESYLPEPPTLLIESPEKVEEKESEAIPVANTVDPSDTEKTASQPSDSDFFDEVLFDYLKEHGGTINLVQCSNDLNLSYEEIKKRLSRLKNLGKIKIAG